MEEFVHHVFLSRRAKEERRKFLHNEDVLFASDIVQTFQRVRNHEKTTKRIISHEVREGVVKYIVDEEFHELVDATCEKELILPESFEEAEAEEIASATRLVDAYWESAWWKLALKKKLTQEEETIFDTKFVDTFLLCIAEDLTQRIKTFGKVANCVKNQRICRGCFKVQRKKLRVCQQCRVFYFCAPCSASMVHSECRYFSVGGCAAN